MTPRQTRPGLAWMVVDQFEELLACIALVMVVLAVSWGVVTRYITEQPAAWASEVATLGFAWLVFFGAAACIKYQLHPAIDMLVVRLATHWQVVFRWFNHLLLIGFFLFMAVFGGQFAWSSFGNPSPILRLPLTVLYGPVAVSFALMAVRYLQVAWGGPWAIEGERDTYVG